MLTKNEPQATGLMKLPESAEKVVQLLEENFAPGMTPLLERVKMPTGGRLTWTLEGSEGEQEVPEITGVILHQNFARTYWAGAVETGKSPDCQSPDGFTGHGDPGGACEVCPLNKWGSSPKGGRAKACTQKHLVYLLRSGEMAPLLISLAPGSLGNMRQYQTRLFREGLSLREVVTSFRLERDKNAIGQDYSKAAPLKVGVLSPDDSGKVRAIGQALSRVVQGITVSEDGDLDPPGDGTLPGAQADGEHAHEERVGNYQQDYRVEPLKGFDPPARPSQSERGPDPPPQGNIAIAVTEVPDPHTRFTLGVSSFTLGVSSNTATPPLTSWRWGKLAALPELAYSANGSPVVLLQVSDGLGHQEEMIAVGDLAEQINLFPVGAELKLQGEYRSTSRKGAMVNTFWVTSFERVLPREQPAPDAEPAKDDFPF